MGAQICKDHSKPDEMACTCTSSILFKSRESLCFCTRTTKTVIVEPWIFSFVLHKHLVRSRIQQLQLHNVSIDSPQTSPRSTSHSLDGRPSRGSFEPGVAPVRHTHLHHLLRSQPLQRVEQHGADAATHGGVAVTRKHNLSFAVQLRRQPHLHGSNRRMSDVAALKNPLSFGLEEI